MAFLSGKTQESTGSRLTRNQNSELRFVVQFHEVFFPIGGDLFVEMGAARQMDPGPGIYQILGQSVFVIIHGFAAEPFIRHG